MAAKREFASLVFVAKSNVIKRHVSFGEATCVFFEPDAIALDTSLDVSHGGEGDEDDGEDDLQSLVEAHQRFELAKTNARSLFPRLTLPVTLRMEQSPLWKARFSRSATETTQ
eukprot:TRINITY_DN50057_c0_g1_i1.p1 TRINITY_DN50057_c0_g1~~TRINITY_DN50057_c0_g1_i1.p1  ORF type:complete len:129 (-),score=18.63 TRINITY_DN50057_c0_g1_i1:363-701(-)